LSIRWNQREGDRAGKTFHTAISEIVPGVLIGVAAADGQLENYGGEVVGGFTNIVFNGELDILAGVKGKAGCGIERSIDGRLAVQWIAGDTVVHIAGDFVVVQVAGDLLDGFLVHIVWGKRFVVIDAKAVLVKHG